MKSIEIEGTNEEAEPKVQPAKRTKKDSAMRYLLGTLSYEDNMKTCSNEFYGRGDSNEYSNSAFSGNNYSNIDFAYSFQHYSIITIIDASAIGTAITATMISNAIVNTI